MAAPEPAANTLANLVLALLAPMFLWSTEGDIRLAYTAAAQTLNEYRITNRLSLFTAAKIIAFDIATLSSLSLSMYDDVSTSLALRLRGNANGLDRSGERARRLLDQESRAGDETDISVEAAVAEAERMVREAKARIQAAAAAQPDAAPAAPPAAERPAPPGQPRTDATTALAEASNADLPPAEPWQEMARIMALPTAAAPPPNRAMAAA
jgi:hypothetical protein